jgi:hypothetical protein
MILIEKINIAVKKINPNAIFTVSVNSDNSWNITWLEDTIEISKSDIEAQFSNVETDETEKENKKTSGKQKLKDLGLDDDEIQAIMGI